MHIPFFGAEQVLITKFNKMIRNRLLWGVFAAIVVIAFVFAFSPGRGGGGGERDRGGVGELYGEDVSPREFGLARFFALGMRDPGGLSEEAHAMVNAQTWRRLAALHTADRLGVTVSDKEVASTIHRDPAFAVAGVFNKDRYQAVVSSRWRFKDSVSVFEEYLRQDLKLQKLAGMLESAIWISPTELMQRLDNLTDRFTIEYALLGEDDYEVEVEVSTNEVKRFFNDNIDLFTIPEKVSVKYVEFPISNYLAVVELADGESRAYYTNNLEGYASIDTNAESLYVPFEDVQDEIEEALLRQKALFAAKDEATKLVVTLAPDRAGMAPTIEDAASDMGLAVEVSGFFSLYEDVEGLDVGLAFNRTAFELDAEDPERYFSDAIAGEDSVYVIAVRERSESRVPGFDEVADSVEPVARAEAERVARLERLDGIRDEIETVMGSDKSFSDALAGLGLNVSTSLTFSAYEAAPEEVKYFEVLVPGIMDLRRGELSAMLETPDGFLLAHAADRQPADPGTTGFPRGQILGAITRYRAELLFRDWSEFVLTEADFKDLRAQPAGEDEEGGEAGEAGETES